MTAISSKQMQHEEAAVLTNIESCLEVASGMYCLCIKPRLQNVLNIL